MIKPLYVLRAILIYPVILNALSWIDLPNQPLTKIFHLNEKDFQKLEIAILDYHAIVKDKTDFLEERYQRLMQIAELAAEKAKDSIGDGSQRESLECVHNLAQNKADYLKALKHLYKSSVSSEESNHPSARMLSHDFFYSSKRQELVGGFEYECADPCHRQLASYVALWEAYPSDRRPPFFLWLETQHVPAGIIQTVFLSKEERDQSYAFIVDNGRIHLGQEGMAHTPQDHQHGHIFVIDTQGQCYLGLGSLSFNHASLSAGKAIIGAGALWIEQGLIKKIFLRSGHYLPSWQQYTETMKFLRPYCQDLQIELSYYEEGQIYHTTLEEFIKIIESRKG